MKITPQARRAAKQLFGSCRVDGVLEESRVRRVVERVLALKPRDYRGVLGQFQRLVKLDIRRRTALVESAVPLDASMRDKLRGNLERRGGHGLAIEFRTQPQVIGGVRIQLGYDVYDGTVQRRLARLAERF